ncbi:MAG: hypothetical protein H0U67_04710 [Gemmatimonadetes bacterium]|nr:hypothetical protein [Gemmatimonadota bacterium]
MQSLTHHPRSYFRAAIPFFLVCLPSLLSLLSPPSVHAAPVERFRRLALTLHELKSHHSVLRASAMDGTMFATQINC